MTRPATAAPREGSGSGTEARHALAVPLVLASAFACLYLAVGPGRFFSVDEVVVLETSLAVIDRGTLDIPRCDTAVSGRGGSYYAHRAPALAFVSVPLVAVGSWLDERRGPEALAGGTVAGPPRETLLHPLRWGGRLAAVGALATNALVGGAVVGLLFLVALRLGVTERTAIAFATLAGLSSSLFSESTHYFQHPLEALFLLLAFWALSDKHPSSALLGEVALGGVALTLAVLSRPNVLPAACVIALYGVLSTPPDARARARVAATLAGFMLLGGLLTLYMNHLQLGSALDFGYRLPRESFALDPRHMVSAVLGYLVSPGLSVFLYAPPLLLAAAGTRESLRRHPLETRTLLAASLAHLALLSTWSVWHGDLSYGPRFLLAPIVLLLPLSLPVLARAFGEEEERPATTATATATAAAGPDAVAQLQLRRPQLGARLAVVTVAGAGLAVQILGIAVDVTMNEWHRNAAGSADAGAWVFSTADAPILVHALWLRQGQNLAPWAHRALAAGSGPGLVLLAALAAGAATSAMWIARRLSASTNRELAAAADPSVPLVPVFPRLVAGAGTLLVAFGFAIVRPVDEPRDVRVDRFLARAIKRHRAGAATAAADDYALVLGLDPRSVPALVSLGVLEHAAGRTQGVLGPATDRTKVAAQLYLEALRVDPENAHARLNLSRMAHSLTEGAAPDLSPEPARGR